MQVECFVVMQACRLTNVASEAGQRDRTFRSVMHGQDGWQNTSYRKDKQVDRIGKQSRKGGKVSLDRRETSFY